MDTDYISTREAPPGSARPQRVNPLPDTSSRTTKLSAMKAQRESELLELRDNDELTPSARLSRERELRARWTAEISTEAEEILRKLDEEDAALERRMYLASKPADGGAATEAFLARLRHEVEDDLRAGYDPVSMYQDALRFGDKERARLLERVAPPRIEDPEQRKRFDALAEDNEPSYIKEARGKRARLRNERRSLEVGFALQGIRLRAGRGDG